MYSLIDDSAQLFRMELTHDDIERMPYAKLMIKRVTRRNARIAEEKARQEASKRNGQPPNPFLK